MYKDPQQWLRDLDIDPEKIGGSAKIAELVDAQQWLDKKYPDKENSTEIIYSGYDLEKERLIGELVVEGFPRLEKILLANSGHIISIKIVNCPQLKDFECHWISIKEIDLSSNNKINRVCICNTLLESIKLPTNPVGKVNLCMNSNKFSSEILESLEALRIDGPKYYEYSAEDSEKIRKMQSKLCPEEKTETEQIEEEKTATPSVSRKNSKNQKKKQKMKAQKESIVELESNLQDMQLDNEIYHNSNEALKEKNRSLTEEIKVLKAELDKLKAQNQESQTCAQLSHNLGITPKK